MYDLEDLVRDITELYEEHGNMQVEYVNQVGSFELPENAVEVIGGDLEPKQLLIKAYY